MTPEEFYSKSNWPIMADRFGESAKIFDYYDLIQFAFDYSTHEKNEAIDAAIREAILWFGRGLTETTPQDLIKSIESLKKEKETPRENILYIRKNP